MNKPTIIITRDARKKHNRNEIAIWSRDAHPILKKGLFEDDPNEAWNIEDFDERRDEEPVVVDSLSCIQFEALFRFLPDKGSCKIYQLTEIPTRGLVPTTAFNTARSRKKK